MQKCYDTAVLGATFLGLGAALGMEDVVVIEKGGLIGAEYINSYKVCPPHEMGMETTFGQNFFRDMEKRGLVSEEGELYPAPAVYVLSSYLKDEPLDILFMTQVVKIQKKESCYEILVHHISGFETIYAKRILDTTSLGMGHDKGKCHEMKKQLNAIIHNPEGKMIPGLSYNRANGLYTYTMDVDMDLERHMAVERFCELESQFFEHHMQIVNIATDFSYVMEPCCKKVEDGFVWMPSTAYASLLEALDQGAMFVGEWDA